MARGMTVSELAVELLGHFKNVHDLRSFVAAVEQLMGVSVRAPVAGGARRGRRKAAAIRKAAPAVRRGRKAQPGSIASKILALGNRVKSFTIDEAMTAVGWAPKDAKRRKHMQVSLSNLKVKGQIRRTGVGRYAAKK